MFTYVYHFSWKNPLNIPHLQYAPRHIQRHISTALRQTLAVAAFATALMAELKEITSKALRMVPRSCRANLFGATKDGTTGDRSWNSCFFTQTFCEIVGMESGKMWGYWQTWVNIIYIYTLYMHMYVYIYICVSIHICADTYIYITLFCIALHYIASHPVTAH